MAIKRIPCGGFFYDDESIEFDGRVMKVIGGGESLPEVTAEDNGDVLTVVDGAWAKAAPSGGGATIVNFTSTEDSLTADKTVVEILEAMKTGVVIGIINGVAPIGAGIAGAESDVYFGQQYTDNGFAPLMMGTLDNTWMYIPQ